MHNLSTSIYRKIIVDIKLEYTANSCSFKTRIHIVSTTYPQFVNKCVLFILFDTLIIANHIFYYKFIENFDKWFCVCDNLSPKGV